MDVGRRSAHLAIVVPDDLFGHLMARQDQEEVNKACAHHGVSLCICACAARLQRFEFGGC
eukprot:7387257-Prymnesium_polylepis.1